MVAIVPCLACDLVAKSVVGEHVDFVHIRQSTAKVAHEEEVEADQENPEALLRQPARLLGGEERLARAPEASDRGAPLACQQVKDAVLLFGESQEFPLLLRDIERKRTRELK
jgi:hypothetical protein